MHPFKLRLSSWGSLIEFLLVVCIHVCSQKFLHDSSAQAVNRIYEIKGRIQTRPLAICVADVPDISRFAVVDHLPHGLLHSLLLGPVTVVLKRGEDRTLYFTVLSSFFVKA